MNVAVPPLSAPVPRLAVPSLNVTVPVGVPEPGAFAETVAVNVTDWPKSDGLADESTAVVVESLLTICVNDGDALPAKFALPA